MTGLDSIVLKSSFLMNEISYSKLTLRNRKKKLGGQLINLEKNGMERKNRLEQNERDGVKGKNLKREREKKLESEKRQNERERLRERLFDSVDCRFVFG